MSSTFTLPAADGHAIPVTRWSPPTGVGSRGVVQLAHGMSEHAGRYTTVADHLTQHGWTVYAHDHRGHGRAITTGDDLGFLAPRHGWRLLLDDLRRVTLHARSDHPGEPVVLIGHSMGSFLVQQYLFTFQGLAHAAVLSGTDGPIGMLGDLAAVLARAERARLGPRGRSALLGTLTFGAYNRRFAPTRTPFDWLCADPEVVDAYIADPLCGTLPTTQMWLDVFSGLRIIQQRRLLARIPPKLPILFVTGDDDPLSDGGRRVDRLVQRLHRSGLEDVTSRRYPGRHELFNEPVRGEALSDVLTWLDRSAPPTG